MAYTVGSLFAGIGGFDLGFERAGFETVWQVEINEWARKVLAKNFPGAERFTDVRECGAVNLRPVDVIVGGFPCQDISNAGLRAGIEGERSGLWSEMHRVIRELRPKFVLVENVAALLGRGMGRVLGDLAEIGYDAEWEVVSAADVGAPHLRERVWILAYPQRERLQTCRSSRDPRDAKVRVRGECQELLQAAPLSGSCAGDVAYPSGERCGEARELRCDESAQRPASGGEDVPYSHSEQHEGGSSANGWSTSAELSADTYSDDGRARRPGRPFSNSSDRKSERKEELADAYSRRFQGSSVLCGRQSVASDGCAGYDAATWWAVEPDVGRVAHGIPARVDRLRGLGNAVVPQIPELFARRIAVMLDELNHTFTAEAKDRVD